MGNCFAKANRIGVVSDDNTRNASRRTFSIRNPFRKRGRQIAPDDGSLTTADDRTVDASQSVDECVQDEVTSMKEDDSTTPGPTDPTSSTSCCDLDTWPSPLVAMAGHFSDIDLPSHPSQKTIVAAEAAAAERSVEEVSAEKTEDGKTEDENTASPISAYGEQEAIGTLLNARPVSPTFFSSESIDVYSEFNDSGECDEEIEEIIDSVSAESTGITETSATVDETELDPENEGVLKIQQSSLVDNKPKLPAVIAGTGIMSVAVIGSSVNETKECMPSIDTVSSTTHVLNIPETAKAIPLICHGSELGSGTLSKDTELQVAISALKTADQNVCINSEEKLQQIRNSSQSTDMHSDVKDSVDFKAKIKEVIKPVSADVNITDDVASTEKAAKKNDFKTTDEHNVKVEHIDSTEASVEPSDKGPELPHASAKKGTVDQIIVYDVSIKPDQIESETDDPISNEVAQGQSKAGSAIPIHEAYKGAFNKTFPLKWSSVPERIELDTSERSATSHYSMFGQNLIANRRRVNEAIVDTETMHENKISDEIEMATECTDIVPGKTNIALTAEEERDVRSPFTPESVGVSIASIGWSTQIDNGCVPPVDTISVEPANKPKTDSKQEKVKHSPHETKTYSDPISDEGISLKSENGNIEEVSYEKEENRATVCGSETIEMSPKTDAADTDFVPNSDQRIHQTKEQYVSPESTVNGSAHCNVVQEKSTDTKLGTEPCLSTGKDQDVGVTLKTSDRVVNKPQDVGVAVKTPEVLSKDPDIYVTVNTSETISKPPNIELKTTEVLRKQTDVSVAVNTSEIMSKHSYVGGMIPTPPQISKQADVQTTTTCSPSIRNKKASDPDSTVAAVKYVKTDQLVPIENAAVNGNKIPPDSRDNYSRKQCDIQPGKSMADNSARVLSRSASEAFVKSKTLEIGTRSAVSSPCVSLSASRISVDTARSIRLTMSESLEKLLRHTKKEDCRIKVWVRPPSRDMVPKEINVRATAKQAKDGSAKARLLTTRDLARPAKTHTGIDAQKADDKRKQTKVSPLVTPDDLTDVRWIQKKGNQDNVLSKVPICHVPSPKHPNARQQMGLERLRKYNITVQCQAIERIKLLEEVFPGIMPPKFREKWLQALAEKRGRTIN